MKSPTSSPFAQATAGLRGAIRQQADWRGLRFKVPQNIDMQDRIIGPLTMVQFVYAVIGFGLCYVIFSAVPSPFSFVLIIPLATFVVCLDFVKINERPFLDFFLAAIAYMGAPKQRVWHQGNDSDMSIEIYHAEKKTGSEFQHKTVTHEQIAAVAGKTDTDEQKLIKQ